MTKRLAIIDGKSVFYRGYYAMPNLSMRDGTPTGGVYGFAALSLELMKKLKPDYVCVAWDKPKTNIRKRLELYPEYKAGRKPAPPDFYAQVPLLMELLEAFSWPMYEADDYEADDILCTLAEQANKEGVEVCLITSDLDALQCLSPLTHVYALKKGFSNIEKFDPESFETKYGIRVDQFLDLKSLKGDSSDNIPGVPGVGEKTAVSLLQEYETLDGIYENLWQIKGAVAKKLEVGKDSAYLSKEVATLYHDAPFTLDLPSMDVTDLDTLKLKTLLTRFEFRSLLNNLPKHMQNSEVIASDEPELAAIKPAKLVAWDDKQNVAFAMADRVAVQLHEGELYVASDVHTYSKVAVTDVSKHFASAHVITHDANTLCHYLLEHDVDITTTTFFDVKHAAFLLNPLRKSREFEDLAGVASDEIASVMSALFVLHTQQEESLAKLPKLHALARDVDFPLIPILAKMEHRGVHLDTDMLASMSVELGDHIKNIQKEIYELVGEEFNIGSPAQLSEVLFVKLQLSIIGIKKGKTGYSTGQSELDKLRGAHPIIELIEQYRELTKLLNTYVDALPKLVDDISRLHTTFRQDVAATGRLSSFEPNLQNIPVRTEQGKKIREAFVPDKGNVFVSADYSQFELRLAAVLAGDKAMINDFNAGTDIHAKTAAEVYKIPLDNVTKNQRRDAKVINFGVLYGMSPHGLAAATGMSFHDAKVFIDEYFRLRSAVRTYIDKTIQQARDDGYVETLFGRRRPTPDVKSSNYIVRSGAERQAANMPIQGTEADLMKMAMIDVDKKLDGIGVQLLQIHDSILVECSKQDAEKVSEILKDSMENVYPELGIKLDVDVHVGSTWGEV
ncbi:MAG: DNA polymerase I [Candidatus Saccharimonadales bacterium]